MSDRLLSLYCFTKTLGARLRHDRRGLESLEWAVIAAVVIVTAITAYSTVLGGVSSLFTAISTQMAAAAGKVGVISGG